MTRPLFGLAIGVVLCLTVSLAHGQSRGKGGEKSGGGRSGAGKPPGGNWSERKQPSGGEHNKSSAEGTGRNKPPQTSGAEGAAAGAAAGNRKAPKSSGAEGAAAGAAASNRNAPKASGAEDAAAGAAASHRNAPKSTGADGAAAGAAAANRNAPKATGAEGAAAGAAVADRNSPTASGAAGASVGYAAVRNSFDRHDLYGAEWHSAHPGAWTATGWVGGNEWTNTEWSAVASHCGYGTATPVSYNYGSNVTCVEGNVIVDGQTVGTAEEFSQQAADLAQAGAEENSSGSDKWLPLGVFAMVRNEQQLPQLFMQMAVNQQGDLRGNYTDEATDHTLPIRGKVDEKTQRTAWTVGDNTSVMEAGLSNLTQGEALALIHKNGKTDHWTLVRMPQPK